MASNSSESEPFVICCKSISSDVGSYAAIIEWFLSLSTTESSVFFTEEAYDKMLITATPMAKHELLNVCRVKIPKEAPIQFWVPIGTKIVQLRVHLAAKLAERAFAMLIEICSVLEALHWSDVSAREYHEYKSILKNCAYPKVITYARILVNDMRKIQCPSDGMIRISHAYNQDLVRILSQRACPEKQKQFSKTNAGKDMGE